MSFALVFAIEESMDLLRRALLETNIIDWKEMTVMGLGFEELLEDIFQMKNVIVQKKYVANYRYKTKEKCGRAEIKWVYFMKKRMSYYNQ